MIFNDTPNFLINRKTKQVPAHERMVARTGAHIVARQIAVCAVRSLYEELVLYPKPGLVSLRDNGSHRDMNATTFMRSLFSLRHYFQSITLAGWRAAPFAELKQLGMQAEHTMLLATSGVNTHRGAIFVLGMLCAAAGACLRQQATPSATPSPVQLRATLRQHWGAALLHHAGEIGVRRPFSQTFNHTLSRTFSHGQQVAQLFAASGAREEGALGFPAVFEIGVPRWLATWHRTHDWQSAQIDCLFALMANMSDTNVLHRGGVAGAAWVKAQAQAFLEAGGTAAPDWHGKAEQIHHACVERYLSPGGAADLLAASRFVIAVGAMASLSMHEKLPIKRMSLKNRRAS